MSSNTQSLATAQTGTPQKPARRSRNSYAYLSIIAVVVALILWAVFTLSGIIPSTTLPSPIEMFDTLVHGMTTGYNRTPIYVHAGISLLRVLVGVALGLAVGITVGLLSGYFKAFDAVVQPFISFIRPIPAIAFVPLVILYFGIGEIPKVLVIFIPAFTYSVLNTSAGVKSIPDSFRLAAMNMGMSKFSILRKIVLPYALPYIFTGIKVSIALGWAVMVSAELVAAQAGLGYVIMDAANFYRIPYVYLGIAIIGLVGLLFELILNNVEKRLIHWANKS